MSVEGVANLIQAFSVTVACITIIVGIESWRREFIGKRTIELAEDVLHLFYEASPETVARVRDLVELPERLRIALQCLWRKETFRPQLRCIHRSLR